MSSSSSDAEGCSALISLAILGILAWLVFSATGAQVRERAGEPASDFYVENYPWPHSEVDAVRKCFLAIQSRNWQNYEGCYEPSAILAKTKPGLPGKFWFMTYEVLRSDGNVAMVQVKGMWEPSSLTDIYETVVISDVVTVVKARKGFLKDVQVNLDVAMEGWFIGYTNEKTLPFDFSSKLNALKATATPTLTPIPTQTPTATVIPTATRTPTATRRR